MGASGQGAASGSASGGVSVTFTTIILFIVVAWLAVVEGWASKIAQWIVNVTNNQAPAGAPPTTIAPTSGQAVAAAGTIANGASSSVTTPITPSTANTGTSVG